MLQLDPGMIIWTWVTFIGLFVILAKFAWKPMLSAVEKREKIINDSLRKADEASAQAEKMLAEHEQMIAKTQDEIQKMLKDSRELAEKMKNEMLENARLEAMKLQERAQADIEREKEAAILELRKHATDLAIQGASRLIKENLDSKKHRELIDGYIKELDQLEKN